MKKGVYIHIPFCNNICNYCDFCKMYYNKKWLDDYLNVLENEIKEKYKNDIITSIYIGGGTPTSLDLKELRKLLEITKIFKYKNIEFTCECNIDVTIEQIKLLKEYGVNRISVGIQSVDENNLKLLGRFHTKKQVEEKIKLISKYIENINVDLIYAIPNETIDTLIKDLNFLTNLPIKHISTYSLMIEPHTKLYINNIKPIDEEIDYNMYETIKEYLTKKGFKHYEISNYSKENYESRHNLTYWNNFNYYGFGLGASGYIENIRYDNTTSMTKYLNKKYVESSHELTKKENLENEFILGLRKIEGIDKSVYKKYNIKEIKIINELLEKGLLKQNKDRIYIDEDDLYISNSILVNIIGEIDEV